MLIPARVYARCSEKGQISEARGDRLYDPRRMFYGISKAPDGTLSPRGNAARWLTRARAFALSSTIRDAGRVVQSQSGDAELEESALED